MIRKKHYRRLSNIAIESLETRIVLATDVTLNIFVDSEQVLIPADIGVDGSGNAISKVTTTNDNGAIQVEALAGESIDGVTLGDFFETWRLNAGVAGNNSSAILNESQIFDSVIDTTNTLQMFVNGELSTDFDSYILADQDRIVLVYSDNPVVSFNTTFGPLVLELFDDEAPNTVDNFLNYANRGDFVNSFFHRSVTDFVIQGGGFATTSTDFVSTAQFSRIDTDPPVENEPGRSNLRGTIAMAKTSDPDSATNQFFVNLSDSNTFLDEPSNSGGFTVFGQILDIDVADEINDLPIDTSNPSPYGELPVGADGTLVVVQELVGQGEITGSKFIDLDLDGSFDSDDLPVENETVFLDSNGNGVLDAGEVSTQTDADGRYLFQVEPGTYTVATLLANDFQLTSPSTESYSVTEELGRESAGNDFGVINLLAVDDDFEALNDGVIVPLDVLENDRVPAGTIISAVSSSSAGGSVTINGDRLNYAAPGGFTGSDMFTYTLLDAGGASRTASVTVDVREQLVGTVSGMVFIDRDSNQNMNGDDVGVPGSLITLSGTADNTGTTLTLTTLTDDQGFYSFSDVPAGTYTLTQRQPEAITNGQRSNADGDLVADTNELVDIVVTSGSNLADNDFYEAGLDSQFASIAWFFASSGSPESAFREAVAMGEEMAGNMDLAADIRAGGGDSDGPNDPDPADPDAPIALNDAFDLTEGETLTVSATDGVLANDSDPANATLTAEVVTTSANGTLSFNSDGSFEYTPDSGFTGSDSFVYRVSNGTLDDTATVTLTVDEINEPPVASADTYEVNEDATLTITANSGVLANDSDPNNDVLTATVLIEPAAGTLVMAADGSFVYSPDDNFAGSDTFRYEVSDPDGETANATVTIDVRPVNDAPEAVADSYTATENGVLTIDASAGLLANDSDVEQNSLSAFLSLPPSNGTATVESDGSFVYTPDSGFVGTDSFEYTADDGSDLSASTTVTVTVEPLVPTDEAYEAAEDTMLTVSIAEGVLANDSSTGPLTASLVDTPSSGTVALSPDGSFTYEPAADFNGTVTFTYDVIDDQSVTQTTSTTTITVLPVNDSPVGVADGYQVNEDETLTVSVPNGVLSNDSDIDGDSLTVALDDPAMSGTVALNTDGSFVYTPNANYAGLDTFTYEISDGTDTAMAEVTIEVQPINDEPVTTVDSYTANAGVPLVVSADDGVLANDTDPENDGLTATVQTSPQNGAATMQTDGSFTYTPDDGFTGSDTFTYVAFDGFDFSIETLVTVNVNPNNVLSVAADVSDGDVVGLAIPTGQFDEPVIYQVEDASLTEELALNADDHLAGDPTSPVVLVEYLDFQCPACAAYHPIINNLKDTFPGDLLVVTRHLPLEGIHPNARAAAMAAEAAANQGQFDAMADLLFTNQDDWESLADPTSVFETYATQLGLDLTTFQTDSTDATIDQGITDDFDEAVGLGATGTPTFFLAGQQIAPPASEVEFEGLIQAEIDAIDEVFTVNRETGEIVVLDASLIVPSTTVNLPVLIKDLDDSEVVTVQIEIGALSAVQTSSLAIDTALAEDTDWRL